MAPFLIVTVILAAGLPPAINFACRQGWIPTTPTFLFETTWLVSLVTAIIFVYLYRAAKGPSFVQFYLLSLVVKLLACFAYTLLMILEDRAAALVNVVYFLALYLLFTAVEITFLYRRISRLRQP